MSNREYWDRLKDGHQASWSLSENIRNHFYEWNSDHLRDAVCSLRDVYDGECSPMEFCEAVDIPFLVE